jgi:hypothetical protein
MVLCLLVRAKRCATRPSAVAKVIRVHAVEFVTQVAPGVAGAGFYDAREK